MMLRGGLVWQRRKARKWRARRWKTRCAAAAPEKWQANAAVAKTMEVIKMGRGKDKGCC